MNRRMREAVAEIWAIVINLFSIIIVLLFNRITGASISSEVQFAVVISIVSITLVLFIFKKDIIDKMEEKIEIYRILDNLKDRELRERAMTYIRDCEMKLEELSRGLVIAPSAELIGFLSEKVSRAKTSVQTTLILETPEQLQRWKYPPASNYYRTNKDIVAKGKSFTRIIIIKKSNFVKNNVFDEISKDIILEQKNDRIKIYIVWDEDIHDLSFREDFVIIDEDLVHINDTGAITIGGWRTRISKNPYEIEGYKNKFDTLMRFAQEASEAILAVELSNPHFSTKSSTEVPPS